MTTPMTPAQALEQILAVAHRNITMVLTVAREMKTLDIGDAALDGGEVNAYLRGYLDAMDDADEAIGILRGGA